MGRLTLDIEDENMHRIRRMHGLISQIEIVAARRIMDAGIGSDGIPDDVNRQLLQHLEEDCELAKIIIQSLQIGT